MYIISFFKKGDTIQGGTLCKEIRYIRRIKLYHYLTNLFYELLIKQIWVPETGYNLTLLSLFLLTKTSQDSLPFSSWQTALNSSTWLQQLSDIGYKVLNTKSFLSKTAGIYYSISLYENNSVYTQSLACVFFQVWEKST